MILLIALNSRIGFWYMAFVHVSTAYANCDLEEICEEIATPVWKDFNPQMLLSMSEDEIERITPKVMESKPNTYTCSKSYAEYLLKEQGRGLPICIVRPSIIVACWKEPEPGFVDTLNGTTAIGASALKGLLASFVGDLNSVHDIIPLDIVVNLTIASAWNVGTQRPKDIPVYNCCSGPINPITLRNVSEYGMAGAFESGVRSFSLSRNSVWVVGSKSMSRFLNFLFNYLPCFFMDLFSKIIGQKPKMLNYLSKVELAAETVSFFVSKEFNFLAKNMLILNKKMTSEDKDTFYLDMEELSWPDFFVNYVKGIYTWIFKENVVKMEPTQLFNIQAPLEMPGSRSNSAKMIQVSMYILLPAVCALCLFYL